VIEPMKRVAVVAAAGDEERLLDELRCLGVVHLLPCAASAGPKLEMIRGRILLLERALVIAQGPKTAAAEAVPPATAATVERGLETAQALVDVVRDRDRLREEARELAARQNAQRALGRFDPAEVAALRGRGLFVRLYECERREAGRLERIESVARVAESDGAVILAHVATSVEARLPFRELELPGTSLDEIDEELSRSETELVALERRLRSLRGEARSLRASLAFEREAQAFEEARAGIGRDRALCHLHGFCPVGRLGDVIAAATREGWALLATDPGPEDPAPTLLQQPRWVRWFQPVLRFAGVTVGYRECDASGALLVFFALFVGMIVGDAGYGCLMLIATCVATWRLPPSRRRALPLFFIASATVVAWGALTGMWFGVRRWGEFPPLRALVLPAIDAFGEDSRPLLRFCLLLGTIQLTVAHAWAAVRAGAVRSLAELGRTLFVWGSYLAATWLLLGDAPGWAIRACFVVGGLLVVLFGEQEGRGILHGVGKGALSAPLTLLAAVGSFSDVISYLRLFAVGLATREVAVAFNGLAGGLGLGSPLAAVGAVVVVAFGHTLNLSLAALGVLVHGLRLNLLEFSRHLDLTWSGIPYEPFRARAADGAPWGNGCVGARQRKEAYP